MGLSLAEQIARLPREAREEILDGLDMDTLARDWSFWGRPEQHAPPAEWNIWLFMAGRGSGKHLHDETPVPTPDGWTPIGDLRVGDEVFDHAGRRTRVVGVYPQGTQPTWRVTFDDGTDLLAGREHMWTVLRGKNVGHLTQDIDVRDEAARAAWPLWERAATQRSRTRLAAILEGPGVPSGRPYVVGRVNVGPVTVETHELKVGDHVPVTGDLEIEARPLPIDPYLLGLWLGDGFTGSGRICGAPDDLRFYHSELTRCGVVDDWVFYDMDTACGAMKSSTFHEALKTCGLVPGTKRIPSEYLRGSAAQRLALLQGLMDTDGSCDGRTGRGAGAGFVNQELADGVAELARSLGAKTYRRVRMLPATPKRPERPFFGVSWYPVAHNPFRLPRKRDVVKPCPRAQAARKTMRRIVSIERSADLPTTCISVDAESHLFLAGAGMIATHNTRAAAEWIREEARYTKFGTLRFGLVARTAADTRDVMVEGESGIINVSPPSERPLYEPSKRRLTWPNGNTGTLYCASEDTEILTRDRGWIKHELLSPGDVVLTFNERTGKSEWQIAESVHRFGVTDQPVAHIKNRFHDSITTLEHRWPSWDREGRVRWTTSGQIADGKAGTKTRLIGAAPNADLPTAPVYEDAFVEVVAWYMTEGTYPNDYETVALTLTDPAGWNAYLDAQRPLTREAYRSGRRIRGKRTLRSFVNSAGLDLDVAQRFFSPVMSRPSIAILQSRRANPDNCADIERALSTLFGPPRTVGAPTGMTWLMDPAKDNYRIDPEAAAVILSAFADRRHKVPSRDFILSLTEQQLRLFVDRCLDGDGYRKNKANVSMGQNHSGRNEIFALALTLLGVPYSQFEIKKEYKGEPYPWYATSARRSAGIPLVPRVVDTIKIERYTGVVWCPVTANKTWFARRHGKVYFTGNTADEPDTLRGPQFHRSWADEAAAWRQIPDASGLSAWDNLRIATRLGGDPRICVTTTPKRTPLMRALLKEAEDKPRQVSVTRGRTADNRGNLAEAYLNAVYGVYEGTHLARQELDGEMMDDVEGALWTEELIDRHRRVTAALGLPIRVVGVDPSVAENPKDECGIVVISATADRDLYKREAWVVDDASMLGPPDKWADEVVRVARRWNAPVVAEVNQGGAMVRAMINGIDPDVKVLEVHSMVGKALRAEPVALAYEQGRVHHLGVLAELEGQMCSWVPGETKKSPDRLDALVHALTAVLVKPPQGLLGGRLTAHSPAARRIPQPGASRTPGARVVNPFARR